MNKIPFLLLLFALGIAASLSAQMRVFDGDEIINIPSDPREKIQSVYNFPAWEVPATTPNDVFTFARLRYPSGKAGEWTLGMDPWRTDYPDSDLNFSFRLSQLTSLEVNPVPVIVDIKASQLRHYPFVYMIEPGRINLSDEQAKILREWMLNGGFLMVDDFWGDEEWEGLEKGALSKIWPDRTWEDLKLEHEIFHTVFDLKEIPQVPAIALAQRNRHLGITYELRSSGSKTPHYRAIKDDEGRICMLICHNTDLGDGWEREGEDAWYFKNFSEAKSFPMGINILFYSMTH